MFLDVLLPPLMESCHEEQGQLTHTMCLVAQAIFILASLPSRCIRLTSGSRVLLGQIPLGEAP